jgi:hypothetical protein
MIQVLKAISGGASQPIKPHQGIRFLQTVKENKHCQQVIVYQKEVEEEHAQNDYTLILDYIKMPADNYFLSVQTLTDNPVLIGTHPMLGAVHSWAD